MSDTIQSPPAELVSMCKIINEGWLCDQGAKVEPWLMDGEDWRLCVTTSDGIMVRHLVPRHADGHTYMLMVIGMRASRAAGIEEGKAIAKRRMHELLSTVVDGDPLRATPWGDIHLSKA